MFIILFIGIFQALLIGYISFLKGFSRLYLAQVNMILGYLNGLTSRLLRPLRNLKLLLRAKSLMIRFSFGMVVHEPPEISGLALKTQKQRKALEFVLANIWKYGTSPIHFSLRNQRNVPKSYNPSRIGNKPIRSVLSALADLGLIEIETGTSKFTYNQNWERDSKAFPFLCDRRVLSNAKEGDTVQALL